ncbi:YHS domain protein [Polaribacter sp.]|nr:YHS domain protein [Polaribacter sp.]
MKKLTTLIIIIISTTLFAQEIDIKKSFSQTETNRIKHFNLEKGTAISGYDPVAYFTDNKAKKGKDEYTTIYKGVVYKFDSQINKNLFLKTPEKYEPKYGGWCAYAMGENAKKVEINPDTFKIINGELYLFYNAYFNNNLKKWNKDQDLLKKKSDENWLKLYN